jgi:hypothetical protein
MRYLSLVFSAALLTPALTASASAPGPCKDDIEKHCKGVKPGGGRIIKCLGEHKSELSEGCKAAGKFSYDAVKSFLWMCGADVNQHCKDVVPGGGRIYVCLEKQKTKLRPRCQKHLTEGKAAVEKFSADCKADVATHCKGVPPGWGGIVGCLTEHKAKLSPTCKPHFEPEKPE